MKNHPLLMGPLLISIVSLLIISPTIAKADASDLYAEGVKAYEAGHFFLAHDKWQAAVDAGNANAMFNLGVLFANGQGGDQDPEQAVSLYRRAAEAGLAAAQQNLGLAYYQGSGVEQSHERAKVWWLRAAKQDHPQAQFNLGAMLWNGDGVEKNESDALKWFRKSSSAGNKQAQNFLDRLFERMSFSVLPENKHNNQLKAEGQSGDSQTNNTKSTLSTTTQTNFFQLGKKAFDSKDYRNAFKQWSEASEQGNRGAQYYIGHLYENGLGVTKNLNKAVQWYEKSAKNGQAQAQYILAQHYLSGDILEKSPTLALFWMQSAADNNDLRAKDYMEQLR